MSADTGWMLIAVGAALAVVGMGMLWASATRAKPCLNRAAHPFAGPAGALTFTSVVCGVITGAQWAVLSQTAPGVAWAVVLWLPAFLAGATVARLLAHVCIAGPRRRGRCRR